jgi:hypothetical protein
MGTAVIWACTLAAATSPAHLVSHWPWVLTESRPDEDACDHDHKHSGILCHLMVFGSPLPLQTMGQKSRWDERWSMMCKDDRRWQRGVVMMLPLCAISISRDIGENALGVPGRREPRHAPLPPAGRLVGVLGAVIEVAVLAMCHTREHLPRGCAIAAEHIRDDDVRDVRHPVQPLAAECLGRLLVSSALHRDSEHVAVLIDRPPQGVALLVDREPHLVHVPRVARFGRR